MAIQNRRGLKNDFDPLKLLPGEWAVSIDDDTSKQMVWMCFAPGVVKRMGTYEDFVGIYLPKIAEYHDETKAYATSARTSETNAKASETNAKQSELLAKQYAGSAFSGTPEGYAALVDKVDKMDIATTTSTTIQGTKHGGFRLTKLVADTIQNGKPSPVSPFPLLSSGDCVDLSQGYQAANGITNDAYHVCSTNPIPCKAGDSVKLIYDSITSALGFAFYDVNMTCIRSNDVAENARELSATAPTNAEYVCFNVKNSNGITPETAGKITIQINGKYLGCAKTRRKNLADIIKGARNDENFTFSEYRNECVKGVAKYTANGAFIVAFSAYLEENETYIFSLKNTNLESIWIYSDKLWGSNVTSFDAQYSTEYTHREKSGTYVIGCYSAIVTGSEYFIEELMIRKADIEDGTYEPYQESIAYFLTTYPMIAGSTLFREDGLVKEKHEMHEIVFDGVNTLLTGADIYQSSGVNLAYALAPTGYDFKRNYDKCFSNIGIANLGSTLTEGFAISISGGVLCVAISDDKSGITSADSGSGTTRANKINAWCKNNNVHAIYELATPIIETLDTQSQINLNKIETFDGVTHVEFDTRVQPLEFKAEVGLSKVGAYTLKSLLNSESNAVKIEDAITTMLLVGA